MGFVERRAPALRQAGAISDLSGRVLGRHEGVHRFTVGQRKGLGLSSTFPLYVVEINADLNRVTVGPRDALDRAHVTVSGVNWIACDPPSDPIRVKARIRHRHREASASVRARDGHQAELQFDEPQVAVAPGQAVVFYDGEDVVGGGWIE